MVVLTVLTDLLMVEGRAGPTQCVEGKQAVVSAQEVFQAKIVRSIAFSEQDIRTLKMDMKLYQWNDV